ncbi:MAG: hypothetical protein ACLT98_08685 [Eggerthellaceae bacterium]
MPRARCRRRSAQETFLRFVRHAQAYEARQAACVALTIARNLCADAAQSCARACAACRTRRFIARLQHAMSTPSSSIRCWLLWMPTNARRSELRFDQGLGVAEAARVMGMSRFAMNRLLKRALARVRGALALESDGRRS